MLSKLLESRWFNRCYHAIHKVFVFDVTALFYSGLSVILILLYFYGQMYIVNRLEYPESYFVGPGSFYDVVYLLGKNDHVIAPLLVTALFLIIPIIISLGSIVRFKFRGRYFFITVLTMSIIYIGLYTFVINRRDYRFYPVNYFNMTSLVMFFILSMMLLYAGYLIYQKQKIDRGDILDE
ncbi:hypothetical protein [Holzapfeliella sp. JNUCC 72]